MASSEVSISGLKELDELLKNLPAKIEGNIMRGAIRAGLNDIGAVAKSNLSSNSSVDTGNLQRSIRPIFSKKSEAKYGWMRGKLVAGNKKAWYAHLVEFGSGSFYAGKGSKSKRAPYLIKAKNKKSLFFAGSAIESVVHPGAHPKPFMRTAFDARGLQSINVFADYVRKRLPKELKKAGL